MIRNRHLRRLLETIRGYLGDSDACHSLGALYATGDHDEWPEVEDAARAARWYGRGARRGHAECLYDLGFMAILREFPGADPAAGVAMLERAADQGLAEALRLLADLYAHGVDGVAADEEKAGFWSSRLAEHLARHPEEARLHERILSDEE